MASGRHALGEAAGQRLPVLEGTTLSGHAISTAVLEGRRLVVFFFVPGAPDAEALAPALAPLVPLRATHNFELLGVAMSPDPAAAARFAGRHDLAFPILDDRGGALARRMGLSGSAAVIVADGAGRVRVARRSFSETHPARADRLGVALRESLRLPDAGPDAGQELLDLPVAPDFERPVLGEDGSLRLSELRGRAVALVFFLHHCPFCHAAIRTLQHELAQLPEASRPLLLGVETSGRPEAVGPALEAARIAPFPVVVDRDHSLRAAYAVLEKCPWW
jgi:peroxiredoxin